MLPHPAHMCKHMCLGFMQRLPSLRLSIEAAQSSEQEQQRLIDRQTAEKQRVNQRFDAELERLEMLWNAQKPIAPVSLSTASSKD